MTKSEDEATAPSEGEVEEEDVGLSDMRKMMSTEISDSKTGKKKSYWSVAMETMGMASGKEVEGDLWLETVEQGVPMLKKYIKQKDAQLAEEQYSGKYKKPFTSWMDLVPLEEFHVTQTSFIKAFLKWATKDREDVVEGSEEAKLTINASKARRRMDSYFDWMAENMGEDMAENPLTLESVAEVQKVWDLQSTTTDDGRYCWWFDIGKMDQKAIKKISAQDHLRYIVFYAHMVMFDTKAQDNGIIFMEDLDKMGFWSCMTLIPMEVSAKMDRLTIGVLPVKMKACYMFGCARWVSIFMAMMKPFLSKKMRERLIVVTDSVAPDRQKYCDDLIGRANIPDGFMNIQGDVEHNAMIKKFKKRIKKKEKKAAKKEEEKKKEAA